MINRENIKTEISRKYYDLLDKLCKQANTEYMRIALYSMVKGDENRLKMIEAIENGITDPFDLITIGRNINGWDDKPLPIEEA